VGAYDPWVDLAARDHLLFGVTSLPAGQGWWWPDQRAILLDASLSPREARSVLAHELAHVDHGHRQVSRCGPDGPRLAVRQERQADTTAAGRLIPVWELADALAVHIVAPDVAAVLDVTEHLLRRRCADLTAKERAEVDERIAAVDRSA
jgi:Zn-dependent peptidase ImmA (M78 family)